jgi:hypothetical protein
MLHVASRRTFPCRFVDASAGGARLLVPARTPVAAGHKVSLLPLNGHVAENADEDYFGPAVVVRVDRDSLLKLGQVTLGVRFEEA